MKPTNSGLLLHYHSHVDNRYMYKRGLLTTMLDRAYRLSSSWSYFTEECEQLKSVFSKLKYPKQLVDSTVKTFLNLKVADQPSSRSRSTTENTTQVVIPFNPLTPNAPVSSCTRLHCFKKLQLSQSREHSLNYQL